MPLTIPAVAENVPDAATATPPATALDGKPGTASEYARADHTHAARVQRTVVTTGADGTFKWVYARMIVCPAGKLPPVSYMPEDSVSPIIVQVTGREFTSDGTNDTHTSVTVKAYRAQKLPSTITLLTALVSFDIFGATSVAGIKVNLWAADPTQ